MKRKKASARCEPKFYEDLPLSLISDNYALYRRYHNSGASGQSSFFQPMSAGRHEQYSQ